MPGEHDLEKDIRKTSDLIFRATEGRIPSFFDTRKWRGRLAEQAMNDERFKVNLFHFIDVLPSLKSDAEISKIFTEYFSGDEKVLPGKLNERLAKKGFLGTIAGKLIKKNLTLLATQFVAGRNPEKALGPIRKLWSEKKAFTVALLGEACLSDNEAYRYIERYLALLDTLGGAVENWPENEIACSDNRGGLPKIDISLKISSLYSRLDPIDQRGSIDETRKALRLIIEKAMGKGASVTFDMEHYVLKDLTIGIFKEVLSEFPDFRFGGIAIQSYLKDSRKDLKELIAWAGKNRRTVTVRLVKGAYLDYERAINLQRGWPIPVLETKAETDENFETLTKMLLDNADVIRPAVASHNIRSLSHAIAYAESIGLSKKAFEFQTLYGMAEPTKEALTSLGYRVRDYLPVGELLPGMAYLVRRLLENTSNESFLRLSYIDRKDFEELIKKPQPPAKSLAEVTGEEEFRNIPVTDFSKKENRRIFAEAIGKAREEFGRSEKISALIAGGNIPSGRDVVSVNPANPEEIIGRVTSVSIEEAANAVRHAGDLSMMWAGTPADERANYLFEAARWLEKRRFDISALEIFEVGKSWREADADVAEAIDFLNYYGKEMLRLSKEERLGRYPGEMNLAGYIPRGVAAVISPWNFPLAITCGMTAAALVSGNTVLLKPSSFSPVTAFKLVEAFEAVGLPGGVLQFLPGAGGEIGRFLVENENVDLIAFTGSMEVGVHIVEKAGRTRPGQRNIKKVIAEMGGKNAVIIDGSADLDEAVQGVIESFTGFQGQKCSACSRVIVLESIHDDFLDRLTWVVQSLTIGPPDEPGNILGPLIDQSAVEKVLEYVETGKKEARLHYAGPAPEKGFFVGPVIFRDVSRECRIANEEIFGPVLSVMKAADMQEALDIANATPYALTGGLYSRSPANIREAKERFRAGNLYINRKITGALVGRQPFGGYGMSGLGSKAGGKDYLPNFMIPRCVTENTMRRGFVFKE